MTPKVPRAKEFITEARPKGSVATKAGGGVTISIPINITIPAGGGMPTISAGDSGPLPPEPVFVSPLQQEIEMKKAENGKESPVIQKIVQSDNLGSEEDDEDEEDDESNRSIF